jgi:predicted DNA-binding transcriptional regulator YafY
MYLLKLQEQLTLLHNLIEKGATGTPKELALKLDVAERTARNYVEQLREMGATICYCRTRQTYYYCSPVAFKFGYEPIETEENERERERERERF